MCLVLLLFCCFTHDAVLAACSPLHRACEPAMLTIGSRSSLLHSGVC
jgi:hypothetical protein